MTHRMKIDITRDGRWWMVHIPEIDGLTQARRIGEAEHMAREYTALQLGVPIDTVELETNSIKMEQPEADFFIDLLDGSRQIIQLKKHARQIEDRANEMMRDYCHWLVTYGVPVRDIGELLEISPQRVSQLANGNIDDDYVLAEVVDEGDDADDDVSDLLVKLEHAVSRVRDYEPPIAATIGPGKATATKTRQGKHIVQNLTGKTVSVRIANGRRTVRVPVRMSITRKTSSARKVRG